MGSGVFPGFIFYIKKISKFKYMIEISNQLYSQLRSQLRNQLYSQLGRPLLNIRI